MSTGSSMGLTLLLGIWMEEVDAGINGVALDGFESFSAGLMLVLWMCSAGCANPLGVYLWSSPKSL